MGSAQELLMANDDAARSAIREAKALSNAIVVALYVVGNKNEFKRLDLAGVQDKLRRLQALQERVIELDAAIMQATGPALDEIT